VGKFFRKAAVFFVSRKLDQKGSGPQARTSSRAEKGAEDGISQKILEVRGNYFSALEGVSRMII
jgi:hypothetical protein